MPLRPRNVRLFCPRHTTAAASDASATASFFCLRFFTVTILDNEIVGWKPDNLVANTVPTFFLFFVCFHFFWHTFVSGRHRHLCVVPPLWYVGILPLPAPLLPCISFGLLLPKTCYLYNTSILRVLLEYVLRVLEYRYTYATNRTQVPLRLRPCMHALPTLPWTATRHPCHPPHLSPCTSHVLAQTQKCQQHSKNFDLDIIFNIVIVGQ